jgi:uncharacterized membrane protein YkvA (DUF1232 family)
MSEPEDRRLATPTPTPEERAGLFRAIADRAQLVWKLFTDGRVNFFLKGLPLLAVVYMISPVDLLPAWLMGPLAPLGVADDLGVILLALNLFIELSPPDVVREHLRLLGARIPDRWRDRPGDEGGDVIDGDVIDE